MPGRREFGVLDIKAELLGIHVPLTQMGSTSPGQRTPWAATGDGARGGSPRAFSDASLGPETGPRAEVCLTICLLPLSQNPLSSPFAPGLGGPGGVAGELSGATTPCHQWTRPQQQPGIGPGSSRPESASPPHHPTRSLVGGTQSHSGKGSRGRSSLGPHKAGRPPHPHPALTPGPPQEAQSNLQQAPKPALPAFHLPNPFLWPSLCDFGPWFSFQIGGFQKALQRSDGEHLPCGQLQASCLFSLSGRALSWAEGPGAGPRVQPSSCFLPSLNSINLSTPLLWG